MAFESVKEQLRDQWSELWAKIQETSAFNTAREKFESQTPGAQKGIIFGAIGLVALIILSFPMAYISSARDSMAQFEENRELIQGLLRASRSAKEAPPLPPPLNFDALRSRVEQMLRSNQLLPDQLGEFQGIPAGGANSMIPNSITQTALAVKLKKLNVSQIVDLSNAVQNMGSGIKLTGLDIVQTAGQTHYYDMILKITNYGLPQASDEEAPGVAPAPRGGKRPAPPPSDENDEEAPE